MIDKGFQIVTSRLPDQEYRESATLRGLRLNGDEPGSNPRARSALVDSDLSPLGVHKAHVGRADTFESPAGSLSCERILQWPVLRGFAPAHISSFLVEQDPGAASFGPDRPTEESRYKGNYRTTPTRAEKQPGNGIVIDDSSIVGLVHKYLTLTHIKNPILEGARLKKFAAEITENGWCWDGPSCLVVSPSI